MCIPAVFVLTPNRTTATYKRVLQKLKELRPSVAPNSIMSDFEQSFINASESIFPSAEHRGCFFHFRQANYRHVQRDHNLLYQDTNDPEFSLHLRMLMALAFVPIAGVVEAFEELDGSQFFTDNKEVLDGYLDYFQRTWMGSFDRRGIRKQPLFPLELWNCRESVLRDLPKTNNFAEGFHRALSSLLSYHHPSLPKFVSGLLKENKLIDLRLELFNSGRMELPKTTTALAMKRLKASVERYGNVPILDFLRGVAHNLQF